MGSKHKQTRANEADAVNSTWQTSQTPAKAHQLALAVRRPEGSPYKHLSPTQAESGMPRGPFILSQKPKPSPSQGFNRRQRKAAQKHLQTLRGTLPTTTARGGSILRKLCPLLWFCSSQTEAGSPTVMAWENHYTHVFGQHFLLLKKKISTSIVKAEKSKSWKSRRKGCAVANTGGQK